MKVIDRLRDRWECRKVGTLMQSHLDGALTAEDARRVSSHLEACRRCGMEAEAFQALSAAVARLSTQTDPDALARLGRLVAELDDAPDPPQETPPS